MIIKYNLELMPLTFLLFALILKMKNLFNLQKKYTGQKCLN